MDILSISSILPIPGHLKDNDFVFQTYINYLRQFDSDRIVILRPVKYDLNLITVLRGNSRLQKLERKTIWEIQGFHVEIIPFIAAWSWRNVHSLVSRSVFHLNRRRIKGIFENYDFRIIHAQFILSDGLLARILSRKYRVPYVVTTHNESFYFNHAISKRISLNVLRDAAGVFPINHTNYQKFISLGLTNVELSPLGFNQEFVRPQKEESKGTIGILTVSTLIRLKNIHQVLKAVARLAPDTDIHYTIIGEGPERENLEKTVELLNLSEYVTFRGKVSHELIADEMFQHDIFIMPSYFETFGRVYFESMAMGIPVICARGSGIHGIFRENIEGISVDHNDIEEIYQALHLLITNPDKRREIGLSGKILAEVYTWANVAKDLNNKYIKAIKQTDSR